MNQNGRRIVIVGGGIAGLCAAVYAQRSGYQAEVLEMHTMTGGLAMSWHRHGYTFETCLHWLVGSKPGSDFNRMWREVCDIDQLQFMDPVEFVRMEDEHGQSLPISTNVNQLEKELLERAPQDAKAIHSLARHSRVQQIPGADAGQKLADERARVSAQYPHDASAAPADENERA